MTRLGLLRRTQLIGALAACSLIVGSTVVSAAPETSTTVRQVGTYDYLAAPDYTGLMPAKKVAAGLTLGLGTFDRLDGELVLVAGKLYRVSTDGMPTLVTDDRSTPFFEGVKFKAEVSGPVAPGSTCASLSAAVTALAGNSTGMVAVRVRGTFTDLVTRSVAAQPVPYPALATAVAGQTTFPLGERKAVLVGFYTGSTLKGIGAPGLHLHGVTADRKAGGHVLSCVAGADVQLSVQPVASVEVLTSP